MSQIFFQLNNEKDFYIDIYDDEISQTFFNQHKIAKNEDPIRSFPTINDMCKYSLTYFKELAIEAKKIKLLDWTCYDIVSGENYYEYNQKQFNDMHKEIELIDLKLLSPHEIKIITDIHSCIHSLETRSVPTEYTFKNRHNFLTKYFMWEPSKYAIMPEETRFNRFLEKGEVFLDFCYVGKEPIMCAMNNDNSLLEQTCKIIDRIGLSWGIVLNTQKYENYIFNHRKNEELDDILTKWYNENKKSMENLGYSLKKILNHTGVCVIGKIKNYFELDYIISTPELKITDYNII